jgi:hypothetical protein
MGAARKAMDKTPRTKAIPAIIFILLAIFVTSVLLITRKPWFSCGLDVRCNKTFHILKQFIRAVSSLDS